MRHTDALMETAVRPSVVGTVDAIDRARPTKGGL
jgi:hypothetical protein